MPDSLGFAYYLSQFAREKDFPGYIAPGSLLFTSAHIPEERDLYPLLKDFVAKARERNCTIICDIDDQTPSLFGFDDLESFQKDSGIEYLRLDDGFSFEQIKKLAKTGKVALNASTLKGEEVKELLAINPEVLFIHNYYPREETGLDWQTFEELNGAIPAENLMVFIPGDGQKRGPVFAGLPTLEEQRFQPPYVNYVQLKQKGYKHIAAADPGLSEKQKQFMETFDNGVLTLPAEGLPEYLYNQKFTIRQDSNRFLKRIAQSRAYGKPGTQIKPEHTSFRARGSITMDNELYGRYSGEIMICIEAFKADDRVNIIGHIMPAYLPLLDEIRNGMNIVFVKEDTDRFGKPDRPVWADRY